MGAEALDFKISDQLPGIVTSAVEETIQSILGVNTSVKKVDFESEEVMSREISGVMGFIQHEVEGTLALSFENTTAFALLGKFYGVELESLSQEVTEGVAELTNMIHAIVKEKLNQQGYTFQMCLPFVVVGNQHHVFSTQLRSRVQVEFESELGPFWCEIVVYQKD